MYKSFEEALTMKISLNGIDEKGWKIFIVPFQPADENNYLKSIGDPRIIPDDEKAKDYSSDGCFRLRSRM